MIETRRLLCFKRVVFHWLLLCIGSISALAQFPPDAPKTACSHQVQVSTVDNLTFRAYKNDVTGDACLQAFRNGMVIFRRTLGNDGSYTLGQPGDEYGPAIPNGKDVTGRGNPDMLVSFYTGGAHCCLQYYVFELEPTFRLIATLDGGSGDGSRFQMIDGKFYFVGADWTFSYWQASFADSPAPGVIVGFVDDPIGGGYHLALGKMKKPQPTPEEWKEALSETRSAFGQTNPFSGGIGSQLWGNMLDFIYGGHSNLAWKILDESWPARRKGKDNFLSDFCSQLKTSPYWLDLKPTITDLPQPCANARPAKTGS
ncbi:MAG TPA: hypothetical protein VME23_16545 [Terracidiphilus sp.]|nr:hypothetical protein [Terracidiphilus sp.]